MATHGDTRQVNVAVWLGVAGSDDLEDVDAVARREHGELVGQTDVDVAVGRLGQLGQLGRLSAAEVPDAVGTVQIRAIVEVEHGLVELGAELCAGGRETTDQLRVLAQIGEDAPGEHPLGAEYDMEVGALFEP